MRDNCIGLVLAMTAVAVAPASAAPGEAMPTVADLANLSLEQLGNVIITSVSRQAERLSETPASVYVISAADIRRSGVRSIPEALRLAPNLQVAQTDARNYAITARGFNNVLENKLLVLIDGRSIYSPLFSGVFWDAQDVVMEDIERIEVISGPGATIWGANAVNGVINIITRSARDTTGGLASAAAGEHQRDGALRYGGALGEDGHYRVYGKSMQADDTYNAKGVNTVTGWHREQAGFRADWQRGDNGATASGDVYHGQLGQLGTPNIRIAGANLQGSVTRKLDGDANLRLTLTLDHTERNQPNAYEDHLDTVDLELQHGTRIGASHMLVWGGGYRYAWDTVDNFKYGFLPGNLNLHWGNVFIQDEVTLAPGLKLTGGVKYEHDSYSGGDYLPSLRLAWNPAPDSLLWSGLTRSVRAPSRYDRDLYIPSTPLIIAGKPFFILGGGPAFQSEVARTAELGYRAQPRPEWSYSVTAYHTDYTRLRTMEPQQAGSGAAARFSNMGQGTVSGVEAWGVWQPLPTWRANAGLVLQRVHTSLEPGSKDASGNDGLATTDPARHWLLGSSLDLSERLTLDLHLRHNSSLPKPSVPAYTELNMQLLWRPRADIDVALIGQDLLHPSHVEYGDANRSVFERTVLLKLSKRF
ncbi:MAG: TonB-dependent receptor [Pseudomonadota bacterium]|jgi:iron complex outermembrane receptor protein